MNRTSRPLWARLSAGLGVLLATAGCADRVEERKFYVQNRDGNAMTVVRCPNSATTAEVPSGKRMQTTVTIDGVEYAPVAK